MKHYIFCDKLQVEPVDKLLSFLTSTDDEIMLYIDTSGGLNTITEYLLYFLNLNKDRITLISGTEITSNGFWLFYYFKGKKIISDSTMALIHQSWKEVGSYELNDKNSTGYKDLQKIKGLNRDRLKVLEPFLTKKEVKQYNNGQDIYMSADRLRKIFGI